MSFNNLHQMFSAPRLGFKFKIYPSQSDFEEFNNIKKIVRNFLKDKIKNYLENQKILNISPKFRVQGSWAYGTCTLPAKPFQEMDIDYGVYLPVRAFESFNSQNDNTQAKNYFTQVEQFLKDLCKYKNWELDSSKSTCIRLKIKKNAHIDIPLYAVPDEMFDNLKEKDKLELATDSKVFDEALHRKYLAKSDWYTDDYTISLASLDLAEETIADKNIQTIHMAKRDGSWQSSDCEIIREWFSNILKDLPDNGKQLRNICRYLKAWRDWVFNCTGSPSSILLMVVACKYYTYHKSRDDIALLSILEQLPEALAKNVTAPDIKEHEGQDFNRMDVNQRKLAKILASDLYKNFVRNLNISDKSQIIKSMNKFWGERMPVDEDLIILDQNCEFNNPPLVQNSITYQVPLRQG